MSPHEPSNVVLYAGPLSMFSGKIRIALAEKGILHRCEMVPFNTTGYWPRHPVVLAHNPKQQVPVLQDGELYIYDSTIIFEYLEDRYPRPPLYPPAATARAHCRQLEAEADEVFFPHVAVLIRTKFYHEANSDAVVASAIAKIQEAYRRLDARLKGRSFFLDDFTVADIGYFMAIVFAAGNGAGPEPEHESLHAWMNGLLKRPAFANEMQGLTQSMQALRAQPS